MTTISNRDADDAALQWTCSMRDQTFTALIRYEAIPTSPPPSKYAMLTRHDPTEYIVELNRKNAQAVMQSVDKWLGSANRKQHLINQYDNTDHAKGEGEVAVVLNDRDTAVMLKLALA